MDDFDRSVAEKIVNQIVLKPDSVIALSTGRTTGDIHRAVVKLCQARNVDTGRVRLLGIDEVTNVPRSYDGACYTMLKTEIVDGLGVPPEHFMMLPTTSNNWEATCTAFAEALTRWGGIDLLELGVGENGHIGFNQPDTPFESVVHVGDMYAGLEQRIRRETGIPPEVPIGGVTLGIKDLMHARRILLVAKGLSKASIIRRLMRGPVTRAVPASVLQLHPACEFLVDEEAGGKNE